MCVRSLPAAGCTLPLPDSEQDSLLVAKTFSIQISFLDLNQPVSFCAAPPTQ